jgi:hypothetical protein
MSLTRRVSKIREDDDTRAKVMLFKLCTVRDYQGYLLASQSQLPRSAIRGVDQVLWSIIAPSVCRLVPSRPCLT